MSSNAVRKLRAGIRDALHDFPADKVKEFARGMGSIGRAEIIAPYADENRRRKALQQVLRASRNYRRALDIPVYPHSVPARVDADGLDAVAKLLGPHVLNSLDPFYRARQSASQAAGEFERRLDQALSEFKSAAGGRKKADPQGLLAHLARRYQLCFGIAPTTTMDGPFYTVCLHVIENMTGKRPVDASRQVSAAVHSIRRN